MGAATGSLILGGLSLLAAKGQAEAMGAQAAYNSRMTDINIRRSQIQEEDALKRGAESAAKYKSNVRSLLGSQATAFAGQGVDVGSGTAARIQDETLQMGYDDAAKIETNAFREALGYSMQQSDYRANNMLNQASARTNQAGTLLSGGLQAARYFADGYGGEKPKYGRTA